MQLRSWFSGKNTNALKFWWWNRTGGGRGERGCVEQELRTELGTAWGTIWLSGEQCGEPNVLQLELFRYSKLKPSLTNVTNQLGSTLHIAIHITVSAKYTSHSCTTEVSIISTPFCRWEEKESYEFWVGCSNRSITFREGAHRASDSERRWDRRAPCRDHRTQVRLLIVERNSHSSL